MSDETRLLAEIIRCAPAKSVWHITSDSWEDVKVIFSKYLFDNDGDWQVQIDDENRNNIACLAEKEDIAKSIVHMDIESKEQVILLKSYDRMVFIAIKEEFYKTLNKENIPIKLDIELD